MKKKFLGLAAIAAMSIATAAVPGSASAQEIIVPCAVHAPGSFFGHPSLQKFEMAPIRVFYTLQGVDAVADTTDINANGVPDIVENIARMANYSRLAFNSIGFRDPLESARYRAAKYIDIALVELNGGNGVAYDEISSHPGVSVTGGECAVRISVARNLGYFPGNWGLLAHELFHQYLNSSTMFKQSWLTEGLSKWAEYVVIRKGAWKEAPTAPLPSSMEEMNAQVFSQTYPMAFWDRLFTLVTPPGNDKIYLHPQIASLAYVDGTPIKKDALANGVDFMIAFLQALDAESNIVTAINGLQPYRWAESFQKSPEHNERILKVLQRVVRSTGATGAEIDAFLAIR